MTDPLAELEIKKKELKLPEWLQNILNYLKQFEPVLTRIKNLLKDIFKNFIDGLFLGLNIDTTGLNGFKDYWNKFVNWIKSKWEVTIGHLKGIWDAFIKYFTKPFTFDYKFDFLNEDDKRNIHEVVDLVSTLETYFKQLAHTIGVVVSASLDVLWNAFNSVLGMIHKWLEQNGDYIAYKLNNIFTIGTETLQQFEEAILFIRDALNNIFNNEDFQQIGADLLAIFTDAFLNVKELAMKVGRDLLTLITQPFIDNKDLFNQVITDFLAPLSQIVGTLQETFRSFWESIQSGYDTYVAPTFERLTEALSNFTKTILTNIKDNIIPLFEAWADKFDWLMEKARPCFDEIIKFIGNVIELIGNIITALQPLLSFIADVLFPTITPLIRGLGELLMDVFGIITDVITGILEILNGLLEFINGVFTADWKRCWDGVVSIFKGCWDIVYGIISGLATGLKDAFKAVIDSILGVFKGLITAVKNLFGIHSPSTVFKDIGANLIKGLWEGIKSVKDWIISQISKFSNDIINKVKSFFGVHSPSTVFKWIGQMLMKGLGLGIEDNRNVIKSLDNIMNDAYSTVRSTMNDINKALTVNGNVGMTYAINGVTPIDSHKAIMLAKGGIATSKVNATIGEAGKEAVLPLENNTEWMNDLSSVINNNLDLSGDVSFQIGDETIVRIAKKGLLNQQKAYGKKIFND